MIYFDMFLTEETQSLIVSFGALPHLHRIITTAKQETLAAAVACVRNLSILRANEVSYNGERGEVGVRWTSRICCDLCTQSVYTLH